MPKVAKTWFHRVFRTAFSDRFDPEWYLTQNPDVAASGMDPFRHYKRHGKQEGRMPAPDCELDVLRERILGSGFFDPQWYIENNPDVPPMGPLEGMSRPMLN
jgi:hypothetical protein